MAALLLTGKPLVPLIADGAVHRSSGSGSLAAWHSGRRRCPQTQLHVSLHASAQQPHHPWALLPHAQPRAWCRSSGQQLQRSHQQRLRAQLQESAEEITDYGELSQKVQDLAAEVRERLEGTSLYLVGMMGSGKSTVGRLVASALRYPFLDCDALIERAAGASVSQIFAEEGEEAFRELETQVLQELMPFKATVVSTGGGAVVRRQNWGFMHHAIVVWLTGAPELLARRALRDGTSTRPLLSQGHGSNGSGAEEDEYGRTVAKLRGILEARQAAYATADLHVPLDSSQSGPGDCGAAPAIVAYRLLKALAARLKQDADDREAAQQFEIHDTGKLPPSMRVMDSRKPAAEQP